MMSVDASPEDITARIVLLAPDITGVVSGFVDVQDDTPLTTALPSASLPALGVTLGRVLDYSSPTPSWASLTQEYILFLYVLYLGETPRAYTEAEYLEVSGYQISLLTFWQQHRRLQNADAGIVFNVDAQPDGIPRRTVRYRAHFLGLVVRLRVTTHHLY